VTISRTQRLIDAETHRRIFRWVLEQWASEKGRILEARQLPDVP